MAVYWVYRLLNQQWGKGVPTVYSGRVPEPKPSRGNRLFQGIVAIVVVCVIALLIAVVQTGSQEKQADRAAWESGVGHPQAVRLVRGNVTPQPVPQSIDTVNQWWTACRHNFCYSQPIESYPTVFRAGYLNLGRNCATIESGSQASTIMAASTKGHPYSARYTQDGNIEVCATENDANDSIVVWTA